MTAELNSFFAVPEGRNLLLLDFERTILYADLRRQLATVSIAVGDTRLLAPLDFFNKQDEKRSVHLVLLRLILKLCVVARPYVFFRSKLSFLFGHFMTVYYLLNRLYILKWDRFVIEYGTGTGTYVFQRAWEETLKCWWEWHIRYWRFVVCCRSFLRNSRHYGSITKLGIVGSTVNIRLHCQLIIGQRLAVTWDHYHRSSGLVIFWQFFVNLAHWLKFLQNFVYRYWYLISTELGTINKLYQNSPVSYRHFYTILLRTASVIFTYMNFFSYMFWSEGSSSGR